MAILVDRYLNDTLKTGVLAYYRMREGSGTTMGDSSTPALNGTYSGSGISWTNSALNAANARNSGKDAPLFNSYTTSIDYNASPTVSTPTLTPNFDGVAGQATSTLTGINVAAASSVTVEMWVKWDGIQAGTTGTFEALANFGGATGLLLGFLKNVGTTDWRFGLSVRNTGDLWGLSNTNTLALFSRDVYHHIVFVIVNNAVQTSKLYIDGALITMSQQIGTSTTTKSVTTAFALAYDGTASFFGGGISEVAVYNGEPFNALGVKNRFHTGAYGGAYQEIATLPGLETQVEYSGESINAPIILNDKVSGQPNNRTRVLDQYYFNEIGGLDDADIRFAEESNFYRDGTNPLLARYGGRTLTFDGYIEASNMQSMRQLQARLKRSFAGVQSGPAAGIPEATLIMRNVWDNGFDFTIGTRKSASIQMKESQSGMTARRNFLLTLRASFPFFESAGSRTEVLQMGATVVIPHKGNTLSYPIVTFWGPFTDAQFFLGQTARITGTVAASSFVTIDSKLRTCSDWTKFNTLGDFPYLLAGAVSDQLQNVAQFATTGITGGTVGVTRVEVTWKHTVL